MSCDQFLAIRQRCLCVHGTVSNTCSMQWACMALYAILVRCNERAWHCTQYLFDAMSVHDTVRNTCSMQWACMTLYAILVRCNERAWHCTQYLFDAMSVHDTVRNTCSMQWACMTLYAILVRCNERAWHCTQYLFDAMSVHDTVRNTCSMQWACMTLYAILVRCNERAWHCTQILVTYAWHSGRTRFFFSSKPSSDSVRTAAMTFENLLIQTSVGSRISFLSFHDSREMYTGRDLVWMRRDLVYMNDTRPYNYVNVLRA